MRICFFVAPTMGEGSSQYFPHRWISIVGTKVLSLLATLLYNQ